jgi:hypothetical protein
VAVNVDGATIVGGHHELDRLILRDRDEPRVMHHEPIPTTILKWLVVVVPVDVVLNLRPTRRIHVIRSGRRKVINEIADSLQPRLNLSSNWLGG